MSEISNLLPAKNFINVTPSDSALLNDGIACRGILLGVAGDIAIKNVFDVTVVISGLVAGVIHPISTKQILSTSTTATDICVFY
jgi:hypothetical protein